MILLVTDTSGKNGSVALVRVSEQNLHEAGLTEIDVIEVSALAGGAFSAQLVPLIAALLSGHDLRKTDIGAFIVVSGPGSFTGLRVGLAAIKALAEILKKPIVPVSLLEAVALASGAQGRVVSALDAGRGEVYLGEYEVSGESAQLLREYSLPKTEFVSMARGLMANGLAVATPDPALADTAREAGFTVVPVEPPSVETIARLGWKKLQAGQSVSPEQLEANYVRRSDAEMFVKTGS
jgi:tRNA threonylcarbamoyladenosine biosynthesis protein TsaB